MYNKLVAKVNNIDISGFALKLNMTQTNQIKNRKIVMQRKKIFGTSGVVKKLDYNAKICEIEGKIPSINGWLQLLH